MHNLSWIWLISLSSSCSHQECNCISGWFGIREVTYSSAFPYCFTNSFQREYGYSWLGFTMVFLSHLWPLDDQPGSKAEFAKLSSGRNRGKVNR